MKKRTIRLTMLFLALILISNVGVAFATDYTVYSSTGGSTGLSLPAALGAGKADDFSGDGHYLKSVVWFLRNETTALGSGSLVAALFSNPITGNTTLEVSDPIDMEGFSVSNFTAITFNFSSSYTLAFGTTYWMALYWVDAPANSVTMRRGGSGNYYYRNTGALSWAVSTISLDMIIYSTDNLWSDPIEYEIDPLDFDYGNMASIFVNFLIPVMVTLLPAALLVFITRRADKWLLLIGLTIGIGLGFAFGMVPLWLLFLVAIGLIGMAYQSVRSGGDS